MVFPLLMFLDARNLDFFHGARLAGDDAAPLKPAPARRLHLDDGPLRDEPALPAHSSAGARAPLVLGLGEEALAVGDGSAVVGRLLEEGELAPFQRFLLSLLPAFANRLFPRRRSNRSPPQPVVSSLCPQHAIRPARSPFHRWCMIGGVILVVDVISLSTLRDPPISRSRHCRRRRGTRATCGTSLFRNIYPNFGRVLYMFFFRCHF